MVVSATTPDQLWRSSAPVASSRSTRASATPDRAAVSDTIVGHRRLCELVMIATPRAEPQARCSWGSSISPAEAPSRPSTEAGCATGRAAADWLRWRGGSSASVIRDRGAHGASIWVHRCRCVTAGAGAFQMSQCADQRHWSVGGTSDMTSSSTGRSVTGVSRRARGPPSTGTTSTGSWPPAGSASSLSSRWMRRRLSGSCSQAPVRRLRWNGHGACVRGPGRSQCAAAGLI